MQTRALLLRVVLLALLAGCDDAGGGAAADQSPQRPSFCAREGDDAIHELFCDSEAPAITGIESLTEALAVTDVNMLGHSTSLSGRLVSAINPRIFFQAGDINTSDLVTLAFTRGVQRVELLAQDRTTKAFRLYLASFEQACNRATGGCKPGDLFTPAIERDWLELTVLDDEELKNTPEDCRRCHGGGEGEQPTAMLLMREFQPPWMHWLKAGVLQRDFVDAKHLPGEDDPLATEPYAGLAVSEVFDGANVLQGQVFQAARQLGHPMQPLLFPSLEIGLENAQYEGAYGFEPGPGLESDELLNSPTWQALYDAFLAGEAPAPPYHHERITDRAKLARATAAYQGFLRGKFSAEDLPDISDVLPDDQQLRAEMGFAVEPDSDGPALLIQACKPCHSAALDQTISRARFDADVSAMPADEIDVAIQRLELPEDNPLRMPPAGARELDDVSRSRLILHLKSLR